MPNYAPRLFNPVDYKYLDRVEIVGETEIDARRDVLRARVFHVTTIKPKAEYL